MEFKRVNFNLEEGKFWRLKAIAVERHITMTDALTKLVDDYIQAYINE